MDEARKLRLEICQKCFDHSLQEEHSQKQYIQAFELLSSLLLKIGVSVIRNQPPKYLKKIVNARQSKKKFIDTNNNSIVQFPRIGAFEVYYLKILVYSKLQNSNFPDLEYLCNIVAQLRIIYLTNAHNLRKLQKFRDLQYQRQKKKENGPSLYTLLKLQSFGNQAVEFGLNLLIKRTNRFQEQYDHNQNKVYPYSLLASPEKTTKISSIYRSKSQQKLQNQNKSTSIDYNNKKKPQSANWNSVTQRELIKNNQHFSWTQRNSNEQEIKKNRNFLFKLILKEGNRSISNQKLKQTIRNQHLIMNEQIQRGNLLQRYQKNKMKVQAFKSNKSQCKSRKQIKRNNIYFWRIDKQINIQKFDKQEHKEKPNDVIQKEATKNQMENRVNQQTEKSKQKCFKRCSIINRVKQNYLQNISFDKNTEKYRVSREFSRNKIGNKCEKKNNTISKIQFQESLKEFQVQLSTNAKLTMKILEKKEKMAKQLDSNKMDTQNENEGDEKLLSIAGVPNTHNYDDSVPTRSQFSMNMKQQNSQQSNNLQIKEIIQEQSLDNLTFNNQYNFQSVPLPNNQSLEDLKCQRENVQEITAEIRISQKKRSVCHPHIQDEFKKLSTSIQRQIVDKQNDLTYNSIDMISQQSIFSSIDRNEQNKNQWNEFIRCHRFILQPAEITKKFTQQTNFCLENWNQKKQLSLMQNSKNIKSQFQIRGQKLTNSFVIKNIRQIMMPSEIRLFPYKLSKFQLNQSHIQLANENSNRQKNANNGKQNNRNIFYFNKLVNLTNFLIQQNPQIITRIFENEKSINPFGVYCIWLKNLQGRIEPIFINDCFAFYQQEKKIGQVSYKPVYSWLVNRNCMWFMLLEKAVAKVLGGYHCIQQISLSKLMNTILLTPTEPIIEPNLPNLCSIIQQKLENKQSMICSFKDEGVTATQNLLFGSGSNFINSVIRLNYNRQQPQQSIIIIKAGQEVSSIYFKQFFYNVRDIQLMIFKENYFYNQILLSFFPNTSSKLMCRLKVRDHQSNCFFILTEPSEISFYCQQLNDQEISGKSFIYENSSYGQMKLFQNKLLVQVSLNSGQYICVIKNKAEQQLFLSIYSQFQVEIQQLCPEILEEVKKNNQSKITKNKKQNKKILNDYLQLQKFGSCSNYPSSRPVSKRKFRNKHKSVILKEEQ